MTDHTAAETLGAFVAGSQWKDIPEALRHEGRRSILNHVGCAIGVARDPAVITALDVMRAVSASPVATVFAQGIRLDAMGAAFVNAVGSNLLDYDDTHLNTVIHPAAPVAPALFALAEQHGFTGAQVLHAFILGVEVECRIGNAVSPGHYDRGWHITSTCGTFGAAAGAAKLLGLDAAQTAHAIGIASSQAAGTVENLPAAAKNVSVGSAARNGILAALFAKHGYTAAPASLEGPLGWARACGDVAHVPAITEGLGTRWEAGRNTYKPYPAGIVFHAVIDACLDLRAQLNVAPDAITDITVAGDPLLLARGDRVVRNERDARVSIHHSAALGFVRGSAGVPDFEQTAVDDPALAAFRARVRAELADDLPRGAARVTLRLADGRTVTHTVLAARGSEQKPLSDAELEQKYRDNAALGGVANAPAQIAALWSLDRTPDITALTRLLA